MSSSTSSSSKGACKNESNTFVPSTFSTNLPTPGGLVPQLFPPPHPASRPAPHPGLRLLTSRAILPSLVPTSCRTMQDAIEHHRTAAPDATPATRAARFITSCRSHDINRQFSTPLPPPHLARHTPGPLHLARRATRPLPGPAPHPAPHPPHPATPSHTRPHPATPSHTQPHPATPVAAKHAGMPVAQVEEAEGHQLYLCANIHRSQGCVCAVE
jgi:hypothetical protein